MRDKPAKVTCKHGIYPSWTCDMCWTPDPEHGVYGLYSSEFYRIYYQRINCLHGFYAGLVYKNSYIDTTRSRVVAALWRWRYERYPEP